MHPTDADTNTPRTIQQESVPTQQHPASKATACFHTDISVRLRTVGGRRASPRPRSPRERPALHAKLQLHVGKHGYQGKCGQHVLEVSHEGKNLKGVLGEIVRFGQGLPVPINHQAATAVQTRRFSHLAILIRRLRCAAYNL